MADRPEMNQGRRGSTVLYAVFLAALLAVLGMGYMTAGVYSRQELTGMMRYGRRPRRVRFISLFARQSMREVPGQ